LHNTHNNFTKHTRFLFSPSQMDLIVCSVYAFSFKQKQTKMRTPTNNTISYERHGNLIYCYIKLAGEKRKLIGTLNESTRTFSKKISMIKHTFNKSQSIAIAYELLKLDYDFIVIESGYNTYRTTRKYFLENSTFKKFGSYELQKFLPIGLFGMDRAESWEQIQSDNFKLVTAVRRPTSQIQQLEMF